MRIFRYIKKINYLASTVIVSVMLCIIFIITMPISIFLKKEDNGWKNNDSSNDITKPW